MSGIFENLGIDSGIIIIILLILTIFLLVRNISMNMRLSRLERKYKTFMKGSDAQSLEREYRSYLKCSTQPGQLFFVYERNCKRRILRYAQPGRSRGTS